MFDMNKPRESKYTSKHMSAARAPVAKARPRAARAPWIPPPQSPLPPPRANAAYRGGTALAHGVRTRSRRVALA